MKIIATGASGFIGRRLLDKLRSNGHQVTQLVRNTAHGGAGQAAGDQAAGDRAAGDQAGGDQAQWDPARSEFDVGLLDGADAVINLSGAGVGDKRWNSRYREVIRSSRVVPTRLLAEGCAAAGVPVLLNASGIGYYGPRGDEPIDETAHAGTSFLAGVCVDWENAAAPARAAGVRVVHLRNGLVLGHEAGILPKLALVTKLFAGGRLGSGRQFYPWISATDEIDGIVHLLTADISGAVNLSGPKPVTNAEFTKELGQALHRPTPWVVPKFALQLAVGGFADEIIAGQNAVPRRLIESGFVFSHATLAEALRSEIR